jgi:hypothetical protein
MRILQGFLMFMGVLAVLAIVALIVGYVLAILTPDIKTSLRPVVLSSESVDSFNKKMADLRTQMRPKTADSESDSTEISLTLTEEEVNSIIVMSLAEGTIPAKEILINFNDGYLVLYSAWNFNMFPIKTGLIGSFDIEDKKPKFLLRSVFLGQLPLPSGINTSAQDLLNIIIKLNPTIYNPRISYKEITISEGSITFVGEMDRFGGSASASN